MLKISFIFMFLFLLLAGCNTSGLYSENEPVTEQEITG